jgi:hypothetical protein
MITSLIIFF